MLRDVSIKLFNALEARKDSTPDMSRLKYFDNILVFAYGTLQRGHENYSIIAEGSKYLGMGHTVLRAYSMYDTLNGFPMVFQESVAEHQAYIKGEVWAVSPSTLAKIDRLESNGSYYRRQRTYVSLDEQIVPSKDNMHPIVDCQIYLGMTRHDVYKRMHRYYSKNHFYYQWYRGDAAKSRGE